MKGSEFDRFASRYRAMHEANIAVTGEAPEYFADYKMRDFARLIAESGLPDDGHFLDFGSGIGASVEPFVSHLPKARLTCADVSEESLEMARSVYRETADYVVIQEDGRLPMADASVDGAFACCVFHHIEPQNHRASLMELYRVLKPGGLLMIYEHNPMNPLTVRAVDTCPLDENAILIKAPAMLDRCMAAGFSKPRREYRVFFPAALKALRPAENWLRWLPLGAQYFVAVRT